jgi:hypothetical protein
MKISLFLISIALFLFMNTLFFKNETIHRMYKDEGEYIYDLVYQIPKILYTTIFSQIIALLLEKLSLSQNNILRLKEKENVIKFKKEKQKIIKYIKIKCLILFMIGFILLFAFWYYVSAFCSVYSNTQLILLFDSLISYISNMLYPFIFNIIPGIFRILGLKKRIRILYLFSNIIIKILGIL